MLLFRWLSPQYFILLTITPLILGCICGYGISVGTGNVGAFFPYISETGTIPPASCVFGILLNIAAMFGSISIYIRHGDFERNNLMERNIIKIINDVSMFIGLCCCFGVLLVASFPCTQVISVHMVGASLLFVGGVIYCYLQSYLSYICIGRSTTNLETVVRFVISMVATLSLIFTVVFGSIATNQSKRSTVKDKLHWNSDEPGYYAHLVSSFSEWITAACITTFFFTFYYEFKNVKSSIELRSKVHVDLVDDINEVLA